MFKPSENLKRDLLNRLNIMFYDIEEGVYIINSYVLELSDLYNEEIKEWSKFNSMSLLNSGKYRNIYPYIYNDRIFFNLWIKKSWKDWFIK